MEVEIYEYSKRAKVDFRLIQRKVDYKISEWSFYHLYFTSMGEVDISGNLKLDKRLLVTDSVRIADYPYHELNLKLKSKPSQSLSLYTSLKLRLWDQNLASSSADLTALSSDNPYELSLWEGYADLYSFIFDELDLRIGKQRIAWGTADKLNPTDNLNPDDFSDPLNPIVQDTTILSDKPYVKFTLGGDYTFKNGIYINAQWMHGFFTERGKDNLEDYCLAGIEKKFKNDEIKVTIAGILEIKDIDDIEENYGTAIIPEVSYAPTDNVNLSLGVFFLDGKPETLFGSWKEQDQIYLKTEVSF